MKILINLTLYAAILALTGCGDDQAGQAVQQDKTAMEPQWANLENNVYHYPE